MRKSEIIPVLGPSKLPSPLFFSETSASSLSPYSPTAFGSPIDEIAIKFRYSKSRLNRKFSRLVCAACLLAITLLILARSPAQYTNWTYLHSRLLLDDYDYVRLESLLPDIKKKLNLECSSFPAPDHPFDPRLVAALWLSKLQTHFESKTPDLGRPFAIPFNWRDWVDMDDRLRPAQPWMVANRGRNLDCKTFKSQNGLWRLPCVDANEAQMLSLPSYYPTMRVAAPYIPKIAVDARIVYGACYLLTAAPPPEKVVFIQKHNATIVRTEPHSRSALGQLIAEYTIRKMTKQGLVQPHVPSGIDLKAEAERLFSSSHCKAGIMQSRALCVRTDHVDGGEPVPISEAEFQWVASEDEILENPPKYFYEADTYNSKINGAHFDWRFFNARNLSSIERKAALHKLVTTWFRFSSIAGLHTWLAHGTLLGYQFNGLVLDWDFDLDVQVTQASLLRLSRDYNQTLVVDVDGTGSYLLDVSPYFRDRSRGNGNNAIDARLIDTATGLYIDITGLSNTPSQLPPTRKKRLDELQRLYLQNEIDSRNFLQLYSCRDEHYYAHDEISPLKPVLFEGALAYVPHKVDQILLREYPKYLTRMTYSDHKFRTSLNLWVSNEACDREDVLGLSCKDPVTLLETKLTKHYTASHMLRQASLSSRSEELEGLRVDSAMGPIIEHRLHTQV
ncbi:hypothetical protein KL925_003808 [Ogataea polymorpha]|nr:hypothetical protein KL925_003808 [Ogataea polymorpha]